MVSVLYNIRRLIVSRHLKSAIISGKINTRTVSQSASCDQQPLAELICEGASSSTDEGLADELLYLYESAASEKVSFGRQ